MPAVPTYLTFALQWVAYNIFGDHKKSFLWVGRRCMGTCHRFSHTKKKQWKKIPRNKGYTCIKRNHYTIFVELNNLNCYKDRIINTIALYLLSYSITVSLRLSKFSIIDKKNWRCCSNQLINHYQIILRRFLLTLDTIDILCLVYSIFYSNKNMIWNLKVYKLLITNFKYYSICAKIRIN